MTRSVVVIAQQLTLFAAFLMPVCSRIVRLLNEQPLPDIPIGFVVVVGVLFTLAAVLFVVSLIKRAIRLLVIVVVITLALGACLGVAFLIWAYGANGGSLPIAP